MNDDRICANCKHWKEVTESQDTERWVMCYRYPPTVIPDPEGAPMTFYPSTEPTDYCGEFAAPH